MRVNINSPRDILDVFIEDICFMNIIKMIIYKGDSRTKLKHLKNYRNNYNAFNASYIEFLFFFEQQ